MKDLWSLVAAHKGYARYAEHLRVQRVRWVILRKRLAVVNDAERALALTSVEDPTGVIDWLLGASPEMGFFCPDDVFSEVMGYWQEGARVGARGDWSVWWRSLW